jgi:hypothetical protein
MTSLPELDWVNRLRSPAQHYVPQIGDLVSAVVICGRASDYNGQLRQWTIHTNAVEFEPYRPC